MSKPFRIYISDPHVIFREGIKKLINNEQGFQVAGESDNAHLSAEVVRAAKADLLMIFTVPLKSGIETAMLLKHAIPGLIIALLTNTARHPDLYTAVDNGFSGIIHKAINEKELIFALEMMRSGLNYYSPEILPYLQKRKITREPLEEQPADSNWTEKEKKILRYIGKGYHNDDISRLMNLRIRTIEGHKARMIEKAGVPNTLNLILFALKNKLLNINDL